jgi:hypothetical protein
LTWCLGVRAWSPPICSQLVEDIREPSNSATFSAVISIYLLSELQWTVESQILQAATEMRISYLEHLVLQKGYLVEDSSGWIVFALSVKNHLGSCLYPWVLGNIITWAEANMLNMFAMILSEPLVPTYAHVYQHLRNTAAIQVDRDMDHLCDKFRLLLFWDRRPPCDERSVETSFWKWIAMITPKRAARMVKSRFKENLAFSIGSNNWCISQVMAKKYMLTTVDYLDAGFMSLLQARLEEDRHLIDTFALSKSVCRALENSDMATTIELRELQLWNANIFKVVYRSHAWAAEKSLAGSIFFVRRANMQYIVGKVVKERTGDDTDSTAPLADQIDLSRGMITSRSL